MKLLVFYIKSEYNTVENQIFLASRKKLERKPGVGGKVNRALAG